MLLKKLTITFLTCHHDAPILFHIRRQKLHPHKLYNLHCQGLIFIQWAIVLEQRWNRGTPIWFAKRCFNAFTEASANSSFSKTAIDSPVTAETTATLGNDIKSRISHVNHLKWNILKRNGCLRILHLQNISQPCIKIQASMSSFVGDTDVVWTSYLWCTDGAGWQSTFLKSYTHWWQVPLRPEGTSTSRPSKFVSRGQCR